MMGKPLSPVNRLYFPLKVTNDVPELCHRKSYSQLNLFLSLHSGFDLLVMLDSTQVHNLCRVAEHTRFAFFDRFFTAVLNGSRNYWPLTNRYQWKTFDKNTLYLTYCSIHRYPHGRFQSNRCTVTLLWNALKSSLSFGQRNGPRVCCCHCCSMSLYSLLDGLRGMFPATQTHAVINNHVTRWVKHVFIFLLNLQHPIWNSGTAKQLFWNNSWGGGESHKGGNHFIKTHLIAIPDIVDSRC